jgi:hypothetical protein
MHVVNGLVDLMGCWICRFNSSFGSPAECYLKHVPGDYHFFPQKYLKQWRRHNIDDQMVNPLQIII